MDNCEQFVIHIFGRTMDGKSVHLEVPWKPYFFVKGNLGGGRPVVSRKDLWGFQAGAKHYFTQMEFDTLKEFRMSQKRYQGRLYEGNLDPVLRFMHRTGINSTGWLRVSNGSPNVSTSSSCDVDLSADWKDLSPIDCDLMAPFKIMSLDIECYSENGQFPDSKKESDVCFQIAVTTKSKGEYIDKRVFGVQTEFQTEKEMLEAFVKHLKKIDPDVITGWNIFGFDLEYIYNRMVFCGCRDFVLGRLFDTGVEMNIKNLSSSALGNNTLKIMRILGRYTFDMYHEVKREHKFESFSLNNVSKIVLNDQKNDMPVHEIFSRFRTGVGLEEVAEYCLKDTELPHAISEKLSLFQNLVEMAKACWVPLSFLSERGQQIKVFSQMAQAARILGFMIPVLKKTEDQQSGYQGATVLEAQTGAYYEPITGLDFASLYPSIMCAHNLCYSTLVLDPKYLGLPNVKYETFGEYTFATEMDGKPTESLLPHILVNLKKYRKNAKALMVSKPEMYEIYNGQQLAYKISMNSVYGFTGATNGILPQVAIASSVTMRGRQMIEESKNYVEAHFPGAKVRYGDSVLPDTPVLTQFGPMRIEKLGTSWEAYPGFLKDGDQKEQCDLNIMVWTHDGWQKAVRVIRHKCQKKIYRVLTHTGLVDVTEDHSLLGLGLEQLKPKDISIGHELFHSFPKTNFSFGECSVEQAYIYGMFVGDGSCGTYGQKNSWAINNADYKLLEECKIKLENIYGKSFKILETLESSGVYKLVPSHGDLKSFVLEYRGNCYDGKSKKVPVCVLTSEETRKAFLDGLWDSDGCRQDNRTNGCHRIDTKNQVTAQWYYLLLRQMGYNVSINCRMDKPNIYRLTWTNMKQRQNPNKIKKIHVLHESYDGYVYDIETEAGTFQAGIGQMIVKNTDSIMVQFAVEGTVEEKIKKSWELGVKASKEITQLFPKPNQLELEKVYYPYVLYSKKRYAAKMWTQGGDGEMHCKDKLDVKGLQTVRRDSCPYARRILTEILDATMESSDPSVAIQIAKRAKEDLLGGKIENGELIITKSYRGDDYKTKMPHVTVVEKMKQRNPGSEPQVGTRVPFIIIKNNEKLLSDKAEDPVWAHENKIAIDYVYYFEHQLEKPICDLLEPHVGSHANIFEKAKTRKITEFFVKK